jgi:hypothetical protein
VDLALFCQGTDGPDAEAEAVKLAKTLSEKGLLRAFGKARQVHPLQHQEAW